MYDVALYGNLVEDHIFDGDFEYSTLGGIANTWDAIRAFNPTLSIDLKVTSIGDALVLVNRGTNSRVARAGLNRQKRKVEASKANWHHIMYLNTVYSANFIDDIDSDTILSADIAPGQIHNLRVLSKLDYLFISDEEMWTTFEDLANDVKGWVIMHYPEGSKFSNGKETYTIEIPEFLNGVNVLGAGDAFAGAFIACPLIEPTVKTRVEYAHDKTAEILRRS